MLGLISEQPPFQRLISGKRWVLLYPRTETLPPTGLLPIADAAIASDTACGPDSHCTCHKCHRRAINRGGRAHLSTSYLHIRVAFTCLFIYNVYIYIWQRYAGICMSICFTFTHIYLSVYLSTYLPIYLSMYIYIYTHALAGLLFWLSIGKPIQRGTQRNGCLQARACMYKCTVQMHASTHDHIMTRICIYVCVWGSKHRWWKCKGVSAGIRNDLFLKRIMRSRICKNTESRKVVGRKNGIFRRASRKHSFDLGAFACSTSRL